MLTCRFSDLYGYGANGRLQSVKHGTVGNASATYVYNALGQRVLKQNTLSSPAVTTQTVYADGPYDQSTVLGTYGTPTAGAATQTEVIYLPTASGPMPIAAVIDGRLYAVHSDHLNTPRRLTQADGKVAWQWVTTAFGEVPPSTGATGFVQDTSSAPKGAATTIPVKFDLRFPGQVADEESGLFYNFRRSYHPATGRYTQNDPVGMVGGWNRYIYANQNPLSYSDPMGLFVPLIIPGICAAGGCEVAGAVLAAGAAWWANNNTYIKPPDNAYDPNGPKAPGRPSEADGFKPPKSGDNWVPNPNPGKGGSSWGWEDAKGDVWCPTGQGGNAHGGPHWDVQTPGGDYRNVKPRW